MNGILVVNKPQEFTSFDAVAVVRGVLRERKTGHTGTLDPMATGVLPILLGNATKCQELLPDTGKEYEAGFSFGIKSDTLDIWGKITERQETHISKEQLLSVLSRFRGDIMQIPPMYSAVSKDGVRLYKLARQGIEIEREPRKVTIEVLELRDFDEDAQSGRLKIACSKGTYIRSLCDDIGKALGCGCVMTSLCRTSACSFTLSDCITMEYLKSADKSEIEKYIKPVSTVFSSYQSLHVTDRQAFRFRNGGALSLGRLHFDRTPADNELIQVYGADEFLGLGAADLKNEELKVKKLFCQ